MGILPDDFYRMDFDDFMIARQGWNEKVLNDQALVRRSTFIMAQTFGQKLSVLESVWPDPLGKGNVSKIVKYKGMDMTEKQRNILVANKEAAIKKRSQKKKNE